MLRRSPATVWTLAALFIGLGSPSAAPAGTFVFHREEVMGTSLELRVEADSAEAARRAEGRVLGEIDRLSAIFSGYDPSSEFSRWLGTSKVPTETAPELFEVLEASERWGEASGGAFDPRVEALSRLWSTCARDDRRPTAEEIGAARRLMGPPAWRLDPARRTAERLSPCPISLNAIAKGFIVERACNLAIGRDGEVRSALLNVGGDMRASGAAAQTIGIARPKGDSETTEPLTYVAVRGRSVATSGNSQRGFRIGGRWYSHIFDPRSGLPVERTVAATVIAERGADADALATIFNVLSVEESLRLAASLPGVECLIVGEDGKVSRSAGWGRYETTPPPSVPVAGSPLLARATSDGTSKDRAKDGAEKASVWDVFELLVRFEINRPEGKIRHYNRPYLAVWVEDKQGFPVRTLTLWVLGTEHGSRWIPELRRWHRGDQARRRVDETKLVATIARPTRPPGKYEVIWDGKDDHGKRLAGGEYTIFLEAAREHGTYQSLSKKVVLADKPFVEGLKGNIEIKSATLEYRRKSPAK